MVVVKRRQAFIVWRYWAAILVLYGIIATLQTQSFAKVYAAYGGFFILLSILWAMKFDNYHPDKYNTIGGAIALAGVCIIYYAKRS